MPMTHILPPLRHHQLFEGWIHVWLIFVSLPGRSSNIWANKWMTKHISPTLCLGIWNKFTQEPCEWDQNLADDRHGQGPGWLPCPQHLLVGNLTWQTGRQTGLEWRRSRAALLFLDACGYRQRGWKIKSWHWNPLFICAACTVCLNEMKPAQVSRFSSATYQLCILRKFTKPLWVSVSPHSPAKLMRV